MAAQWAAMVNLVFIVVMAVLLQLKVVTPFGMLVALIATIGLGILTLFFVIMALSSLWRYGAKAGWASIRAILITMLVALPFVAASYLAFKEPPVFDVSSDPFDPPEYPIGSRGTMVRLPIISEWVDEAPETEPEVAAIKTRRFGEPFGDIVDIAVLTAKNLGWTELSRNGNGLDALNIGFSANTLLFDLPVDLSLRIRETNDLVYVDLRSALQLYVPDLGHNTRRINAYMIGLEEALSKRKTEE